MLKPLLFVSAVMLLGVSASPALAPMPQEAPSPAASGAKNPVKPTEKSRARAKELYTQDCAICHGDTGNGKTDLATDMQLTIGDWTDSKTLAGKTDDDLFKSIRDGKGKMPPEVEGRASDNEVWNLILYIREMAKQPPAAAPAAASN
ncbi:MAG: cytochrome c [Terracidiphilus sp.]|jgi:mono/diheme cytochrome c family protein